MNYRVALDLLGLAGDVKLTSDHVRRCYMRKLRLHPPERDPEGFQRLREAYELVRQLASDDDEPGDQAARAAAEAERAAQVRAFVFEGTPLAEPEDVARPPATVPLADLKHEPVPAISPLAVPVTPTPPLVAPVPALSKPPLVMPVPAMSPPPLVVRVPAMSPPPLVVPVLVTPPGKPPLVVPVPAMTPPPVVPVSAMSKPPEAEAPPVKPPAILGTPPEAPPVKPPFVVQSLPVARVVKPQLPPPLSAMVPRLLELLEAGDVKTAIEIERHWRSSVDADDVRQSNAKVAARWTLVRELLDVGERLPNKIVQILAKAISGGDLATARPALEAFRIANPKAAEQANSVLVMDAPTLFAPLQHTLWVPIRARPASPVRPPYEPPYQAPAAKTGGGGAARGLWFIPVVLMAMIRLCASSTGSSSYSSYSPKYPTFTQAQLDALTRPPPQVDLSALAEAGLPPSPVPTGAQTKAEAVKELLPLTDVLAGYLIATPAQRQAAEELAKQAAEPMGKAPSARRCAVLRKALKALHDADRPPSERRALRGDEYIAAVDARIEVICPAPAAKPTKPAKPGVAKPGAPR